MSPNRADLDPALGPAQHRHQTQEQHLVERVKNLGALARVVQLGEMFQKIDSPINRSRRARRHNPSPSPESEDRDRFSIRRSCH